MSLTSILAAAGSSLSISQYQMATASANISNASTTGATQKTYQETSTVTLTSAVSTGTLTRLTNSYLSSTVNSSSAASGASAVVDSYMQSYDSSLGSVANGDDVSTLLTSFQAALSTLATSPSSTSDKAAVVSAASSLGTAISTLSGDIQTLRTQASSDISATVASINTDLKSLAALNKQIASATAAGTDTTGLEDQRDTALSDLSSLIGVQSYVTSNNQLVVYDQGGDPLLGDSAATLSYTGTGQLSASTTYPGSISGIMVNGTDITGSVTSGKLGGLISLRDSVLPAQQDQLDQLASGLIQAANAATNAGTAYPPPNSLTSDISVSSSDGFSATGSLRVAVTDSAGTVTSTSDLDLSSYATVGDLVTALNGISGVSASISSAGALTIKASDSSDGIALGQLSGSAGSTGESVSQYFGFNDLFSGTNASTIAVSSALSASSAGLPTGVLSTSASLAVGDKALASSDGTNVTALANALTATRTLSASGTAAATSTTLATAASGFVSQAASAISQASDTASNDDSVLTTAQNALSNATGINVDEQTALLTQYQNQYEAAAQLMTVVKSMFSTLISMMEA